MCGMLQDLALVRDTLPPDATALLCLGAAHAQLSPGGGSGRDTEGLMAAPASTTAAASTTRKAVDPPSTPAVVAGNALPPGFLMPLVQAFVRGLGGNTNGTV